MKTHASSRSLLGSGLVTLVFAAGCSDSTPVTPPADAATTDTAPADVTSPDVTSPDAMQPDASLPASPTLVPVSAMGHDRFFGVAYDSMGSFYAVGVVADGTDAMTDFRTVVAKFSPSGTLDATFGTNGFATHNIATGTNGEVARGIVVQSTGKIVVVATVEHAGAMDARDRDLALLRFNADGTRDMGFGTAGVVTLDLSAGEVVGTGYVADSAWGLVAYSDDRLLVTGAQKRTGATDTDFAVVRLSADGVRDMGFGTAGVTTVDVNNRSASPRTATLLPGGGILVAGYMDDGGVVKPVLFKLDATGRLDTTFGMGGIFTQTVLAGVTEAYAAVLQGTNFVTAGYGRGAAPETLDWISLRVTANGMLDTTYGMSGVARLDVAMFNDNARSLVTLPDNRMLLVGGGRPTEANVDAMLAVLTADGRPDTTFAPMGRRMFDLGGASDFFWGVALSPSRDRVAIVGTKAVAAGMGNDDAAVFVLSL